MHNITVISTVHTENGKCNPDELYDILEDINPEVIFDELTNEYSDMFYSVSFDTFCANKISLNHQPPFVPLEVRGIKKYKENYNVKIIPVDIDIRQKSDNYQHDFEFTFLKIFEHQDYIKLEIEGEYLVAQEGFQYLNSDKFLDFLEKKESLERSILESKNENERLLEIYNLFKVEQKEERENAMLQNIYNYSRENHYNQAVFLIGAGHRKSIMQKFNNYEELSDIKLNWKMYGSK